MGERLKELRKSLGLTQKEFADKLGMVTQAISMMESGARKINERQLKSICGIYGVNEQWLKTGEGDMFEDVSFDAEVAQFAGKILSGGTSLEKCFIACLARTTPEEREVLAKIMIDMVHMYDEQKAKEEEKNNKES